MPRNPNIILTTEEMLFILQGARKCLLEVMSASMKAHLGSLWYSQMCQSKGILDTAVQNLEKTLKKEPK